MARGEINKNTSYGFASDSVEAGYDNMKNKIMESVKRVFNPEFVNRIDDIIVFHQLAEKHMIKIVELVLRDMLDKVAERKFTIELSQGAKEFIAKKGFDPVYGARPLKRAIQRFIEDPLATEILKGRFGDGAQIKIRVKGDELAFSEGKSEPIDEVQEEKES